MRNRIGTLLVIGSLIFLAPFVDGQTRHPQRSILKRTHKSWIHERKRIAPLTLSASRRLVTVGDTLYMIDSHDAVVWKWDVGHGEDIMDRPYVNSHGQIFGIALDGIVFSLDSYGKERWRWQINGSYSFTQLKPYRDGQYLMVLDASAYRKFKGFNEDDVLYLCRDRDVITTVSFPRTARLALNGNQIFAVTMHQHRQRKQRIVIPGRA